MGWVMERVQPLFIVPGMQDDVVPPVLAGEVSPEVAGPEHHELMDNGHSGVHVGIISDTAGFWEVAQELVADGL